MRFGRKSRQATSFSAFRVRKHRPDYGLIIIASILLVIGLIVMYAISPALSEMGNRSESYYVSRQFIAIVIGFIAFYFASRIPPSTWERWLKPMIIVAFVLSLSTLLFGGLAYRWIPLGTFSFQPVELVKFTMAIAGAFFLAKVVKSGEITKFKALKPLVISFVVFSVVVIGLQRDLGSAFVLFSMAGIMAYVAGLPMKRLLLFAGLVIAVIVIAIGSTGYRRDRFLTFMQPNKDCTNSGYHACQALIAVGSGGLFGAGLGHSVQAYGYLPMADNDSIFAIYSEKFGFFGGVILFVLYGSLLLRILNIMQRAPNKASQLMCAGVFAWLGVQAIVNIGAMIGLLPLKGITLPLISAGGTSLIYSMMALGVVFQISAYTSMRVGNATIENERRVDENNYDWRRDSRPHYSVTRSS
jgi:cell division protein FtsW